MAPSLAHDQTDVQADASSGSHLAWLRAEEERVVLRRTWAEWFAGHDLLLLPVMTVAAITLTATCSDPVNGTQSPFVAVARRLAIALWRFLADGVLPAGASLKKA